MQFVPVRGSDRKLVVDDQDYDLVGNHPVSTAGAQDLSAVA
ncbi:hypothetical protein [Caenispirillum bisanense]|uniref:Uncharacterized protein n=1 Tax=Caenispirillum bisanense TaxID=414052 RepID=A0A286H2D6_9PROT|nr:hypothetical protein [Caenispirillum bisanense]SOE01852.1 hypothetical protein SAMN05421508_1285 [Caenispirillum bisanense]